MKSKTHTHRFRPTVLTVSVAALLSVVAVGRAAVSTWKDTGGTFNWGEGTNWLGGTAPSNGDDLIIDGGAGNTGGSVNFANPPVGTTPFLTNVNSITINAGQATSHLGGGQLTIAAGGITNNSVNTITLDFVGTGITLSAGQTWNAAAGALNVTAGVNLNGQTLTVDGANNTTLGGAVTGSGGLIKNGAGNLIITNPLTLSGNATLNAGTVTANGGLTVSGTGALSGTGTLASSLTYTSSATSAFDGTITGAASTVVVNNELTGSFGTLGLSTANTYGGGTTVTAGYLETFATGTLGSGNVVIGSSAASTATLAPLTNLANAITINGFGSNNFGAGKLAAIYVFNGGTTTLSGAITVASNASIGVDKDSLGTSVLNLTGGVSNSASTLKFTPGINGAGTVNINTIGISGGGNVDVAGALVNFNASNTYTGTTTVEASGVLNVNGTTTGTSNVFVKDTATLNIGAAGNLTTPGTVLIADSAFLSASAATSTITGNVKYTSKAISGYDGIIAGAASTLVVDNEATGSSGTLELGGVNTYGGGTTVASGYLETFTAGTLGSGNVVIGSSAASTATLAPLTNLTNTITINGFGSTNFGVGKLAAIYVFNGGTTTLSGAITVASNASIGVDKDSLGASTLNLTGGVTKNGTTLTFVSGVNGGGIVNISTVGIDGAAPNSDLVVSGLTVNENIANTYNGATWITNGGTLNANVADALPIANGRSAVIMDPATAIPNSSATSPSTGGSQLNLGAAQSIASLDGAASSLVNLNANTLTVGTTAGTSTFDGVISGAGGALIKDGASTLVLSGANTYTGATVITAGRVVTNNATALGAGPAPVFLGGNATLQVNGLLNVNSLVMGPATLNFTPSAGDKIAASSGFLPLGGAAPRILEIDTAGIQQQTAYTLVTGPVIGFAPADFTVVAENPGVTLQFTLTTTSPNVILTITGATASGAVLQNSAPVNIPTFADFTVSGPVQTGGPNENNTVNSLTFQPNSSLTIHNTLFVTTGPVNVTPGSSIQLGQAGGPDGFLSASQLNLLSGSVLSGNGGIIGNLVNAGLVSPGNSPGHIHVSGNYTQTPTGTLRIEIAGRDLYQHDLLSVGGTASLDGTLQIVPLDGFKLKRNKAVTFLTANGGVSGEFAEMENSFPSDTILKPTVVYHQNSVALEAVQASFGNLPGLTPNQRSVGRALDSAAHDRRADSIFEYLDYRKLNKLPGDLDKIAPEELTSVFTLGTSLAQVQSGNIQRRGDDIRTGSDGFSAAGLAVNGTGPSYSGSFRTGMAGPNGVDLRDDGKDIKETKDVVAPAENRWGAFLSGTGEWVSVGNTDNARGYDLTSGGFTLGLDYKVTPNLAIGLAGGYTGSSADLTDRGRAYVNGGKIGLYATFFDYQRVTEPASTSKDAKEVQAPVSYNQARGFYADVAVFGGYNSYDFRRSALQGEARGDTDGGELNVLAGIGYDFKKGHLTFGPTASFNYTYLGTSDFTEHGSLTPLNVHGGKGESLRTAFGLKASYDWRVGSVLIKPEIRAAWQHEFGDAAYALDSDFANGAGNSFRVNGPNLGRDSALLGAGFAIQFNERFSTYFYYDGELGRKDYQSTSVTGGVRLTF